MATNDENVVEIRLNGNVTRHVVNGIPVLLDMGRLDSRFAGILCVTNLSELIICVATAKS